MRLRPRAIAAKASTLHSATGTANSVHADQRETRCNEAPLDPALDVRLSVTAASSAWAHAECGALAANQPSAISVRAPAPAYARAPAGTYRALSPSRQRASGAGADALSCVEHCDSVRQRSRPATQGDAISQQELTRIISKHASSNESTANGRLSCQWLLDEASATYGAQSRYAVQQSETVAHRSRSTHTAHARKPPRPETHDTASNRDTASSARREAVAANDSRLVQGVQTSSAFGADTGVSIRDECFGTMPPRDISTAGTDATDALMPAALFGEGPHGSASTSSLSDSSKRVKSWSAAASAPSSSGTPTESMLGSYHGDLSCGASLEGSEGEEDVALCQSEGCATCPRCLLLCVLLARGTTPVEVSSRQKSIPGCQSQYAHDLVVLGASTCLSSLHRQCHIITILLQYQLDIACLVADAQLLAERQHRCAWRACAAGGVPRHRGHHRLPLHR